MAIADHPQITTAEQLYRASGLGRCELVRGELIAMPPAGFEHGGVEQNVATPLDTFVRRHRLGRVVSGDTGFVIARDPDTVRAPDVAFVRAERLGHGVTEGFFPGPPDLAVEVVSPSDRAGEVLAKVWDWLDAGCRAVWLADPETRTVTVYRSRNEIVVLRPGDALTAEDLLPGFSLPVAEVFA